MDYRFRIGTAGGFFFPKKRVFESSSFRGHAFTFFPSPIRKWQGNQRFSSSASSAPASAAICGTPEAIDGPLVHDLCAQRLVELDGEGIPVKALPVQPPPPLQLRHPGKTAEQRLAISLAALLRQNKEVPQIEVFIAPKGKKIIKIQCETHRFVRLFGDQHHGVAPANIVSRSPSSVATT